MTMYIHESYKFNFFSPLFLLLGSIFAVYEEFIPAGIFFLLGILFLISFQGIRIDIEGMRMQKFNKILWIRFGKWIPVQPVQYLTINRYNIRGSQSNFLTGSDSGSSVYKAYKVNMVFEGKNLYISLMRGKREKMVSEAIMLVTLINCRVLDYSTHEKKWLL